MTAQGHTNVIFLIPPHLKRDASI